MFGNLQNITLKKTCMINIEKKTGASLEAIQHHYDVSNDFYSLWLDSTRTYSCALFESGDSLEIAQQRKLDYHISESKANTAKRLLDIGCGWGSTLKRALDTTNIKHGVGLTLSQEQANYCNSFQNDRMEIRIENWADHTPDEQYDSIISIGAFEHFSRPDQSNQERIEGYRNFFMKCRSWLKPNGYMSLQTIAYGTAERKDINKFILDEIFPESDLPFLEDIILASKGIFEVCKLRNDRLDYANTFRFWKSNLKKNRHKAVEIVGEEKVIIYEKYQDLFIIGFHIGSMNLYRITFKAINTI
jgi:cyclopropane-fatty-acyl-phospholipid synthase